MKQIMVSLNEVLAFATAAEWPNINVASHNSYCLSHFLSSQELYTKRKVILYKIILLNKKIFYKHLTYDRAAQRLNYEYFLSHCCAGTDCIVSSRKSAS